MIIINATFNNHRAFTIAYIFLWESESFLNYAMLMNKKKAEVAPYNIWPWPLARSCCHSTEPKQLSLATNNQGPVVQKPMSINLELNF